jgi:hypothetical protein
MISDDFKVIDWHGHILGPLNKHPKHPIGLDYVRYTAVCGASSYPHG